MFYGGFFLAGLAIARFLKARPPQRAYASYADDYGTVRGDYGGEGDLGYGNEFSGTGAGGAYGGQLPSPDSSTRGSSYVPGVENTAGGSAEIDLGTSAYPSSATEPQTGGGATGEACDVNFGQTRSSGGQSS
jgi:hypothetical protein